MPKIPTEKSELVNFDDLKPQDCFLYQGKLWMISGDRNDQVSFCLSNGETDCDFCERGQTLLPVNVEIKWSRPKVTKKNKFKVRK